MSVATAAPFEPEGEPNLTFSTHKVETGKLARSAEEKRLVDLHRAVELAEELNRADNGIVGVSLHLHGDYSCVLVDKDRNEVGRGYSKRSLTEALVQAELLWKDMSFWKTHTTEGLAEEAVRRFAPSFELGSSVFNTACFQNAFQDAAGFGLSPEKAVELLSSSRHIVRLCGGCHWFLLPGDLKRHDDSSPGGIA